MICLIFIGITLLYVNWPLRTYIIDWYEWLTQRVRHHQSRTPPLLPQTQRHHPQQPQKVLPFHSSFTFSLIHSVTFPRGNGRRSNPKVSFLRTSFAPYGHSSMKNTSKKSNKKTSNFSPLSSVSIRTKVYHYPCRRPFPWWWRLPNSHAGHFQTIAPPK